MKVYTDETMYMKSFQNVQLHVLAGMLVPYWQGKTFKCTKFLSHCLRVTPIKHKICVHCTPSNILKLFHIYIVHVHALNRNLIENSFFYNNMLNNRLVHVHQLSFSLHSKSSPMSKYTS